jgi:transposase
MAGDIVCWQPSDSDRINVHGMTIMTHRWAETPMPREQMALFSPTLDDAISQDHPVRLLDEILRGLDWSDWVTPCSDHRGRLPIHPRVLAAIILYGLMRRIRSSRMLEYMCGHNVDFLWLAEGHCPDHSTLCGFRKESRKALKGLFRQVGRLAMAMGLVQLVEVAFDGTRVKANASRHHTWTAARAEAALKELDGLFDRMMAEADQADARLPEGRCLGESVEHLPADLATLAQRQRKLQEILQTLQSQDAARRKQGKDPEKNPAQMPKADSDSKVMPNKEGGYAANYTPTAAVDVSSGMIVDCEVIADANEQSQTLPAVDRIAENFGQFWRTRRTARERTWRGWRSGRSSSSRPWNRRSRRRAIRRGAMIRLSRWPKRIGRGFPATHKSNWTNRASSMWRTATATIVPKAGGWNMRGFRKKPAAGK